MFAYPGRVPCFLQRNINKANKKMRESCLKMPKRRRRRNSYKIWHYRKNKPYKATKEFFFQFKSINAKRAACGNVENSQAKRLCLEPKTGRAVVGEGSGKHQVMKSGVESLISEQVAGEKAGSRQVERLGSEPENCRNMVVERSGKIQARRPDFECNAGQLVIKRNGGGTGKRLSAEGSNSDNVVCGRVDKGHAKATCLGPLNTQHLHAGSKVDNDHTTRWCQNRQEQSSRKKNTHDYDSDYRNLLVAQNNSNFDSVFGYDDPGTVGEEMETLTDDESNSNKEYSPKACLKKMRSCCANNWKNERPSVFKRQNNDNLNSEFNESQMIRKSELSKKEETYPERLALRSGMHRESSHPKIELTSMGEDDLEFEQSQSVHKGTGNKGTNSEAVKRHLVGRISDANSKQARRSSNSKYRSAKTLKVFLIDCFASDLQARQISNQFSFQPTSTPKAMRVQSRSQEVSVPHTTPKVPSNIIPKSHVVTPRVTTSDITLIATSDIFPETRKSRISSNIPKSIVTPPESEASCLEDEYFTHREKFRRHEFLGSSEESSMGTPGRIAYTPLFSSKPRLWKSVVVENDN